MIWNFDPIAFSIFGLDIRWYGLAYILGFFLALQLGWRIKNKFSPAGSEVSKQMFEDLTFGLFFSGVLGGRLGHFLFYAPETFVSDFFEIFKIWHGGMSIHGGIIGAIIFAIFWQRKHHIPLLWITDIFTLPLSIALVFGRIANFLNGELVGRPTNVAWGIIFPHVDNLTRHPAQLYEAGKNLLIAIVLSFFLARGFGKKEGFLTALFLAGYGIFRFFIEFVKESERSFWIFTNGQWLCIFMVLGAILLAKKQNFWHNGRNTNISPSKK